MIMAKNIVAKVLQSHFAEGDYVPGEEIGIRVDQTLVHDATGTMAFLQFEALGVSAVRTDRSVTYIDHNTQQIGFENSDDHLYLQSVSAKFGVVYSRAGNGICHQVHLERFGRPGSTLLGADSHTPTGGGIGQIAVGAGGLDVAVAMGGGPFRIRCPRVYRVNLSGQLREWVSAKDVVLHLLSILTTKGNVGMVLEYGGEGVKSLGVPARATIANMGAEMGVTTSIFPSDETTRRFLKAQGRENDWCELSADPGARYDRIIEVDLAALEPLVAAPHSPGNVVKLSEVEGLRVDQVCIGSCTNSSYRDMMTAAAMLRGRSIHSGISLGVAPGSRQILRALARNGALDDLIGAGARIMESACGFCVGVHFSPQSGGVSVRTSNRNFEGRSGTQDARVYLCSPEVAAAAAITGQLTAPERLEMSCPKIQEPDAYRIDDSMFIFPDAESKNVAVIRGPNIGDPPRSEKMTRDLSGRVLIKLGDHITTDHITPAGARLKYRSNVPKYSEFVFEKLDPSFSGRCLENKAKGIHNVIVAGESYGQGSSREHASMCPMYLGVKAVIAKSFERIHSANLVNFGILPLVLRKPADFDGIMPEDGVSAANWREAVAEGEPIVVRNERSGAAIKCTCALSAKQTAVVMAGGLLNYIMSA
jgi:aconitate hydratase